MTEVTRRPCPFPARAWWGEQLVAETTAAVRVEAPEGPPQLYFPRRDVRFDLFTPAGRPAQSPVLGRGELWSIAGTVPKGLTWHDDTLDRDATVDGVASLWSYTEPAPGLEWLADLAAFDHTRVRVELVDAVGGDEARDITTKRFPVWGDATELIDIMNVRPAGERRYLSVTSADATRPVVEASQMLGQAIVAASRHAPGRRVVGANLVAYRPADSRLPLELELDELQGGRAFATLLVHVGQAGRRRATVLLLLGVPTPDVIRHAAPPPPCPGPYDSEPYDMSVTGRDLRVAHGAYTDDPHAPVGPPVIDAWVRFREVPDDQALHAGLLAQFTGHMSIATALRPHEGIGQWAAHRTLSMGINAISISFHADVRADRWMRYHHHSTFAGDGMTHSECRVYTEDGELVASFTVEAMVRHFTPSPATTAEGQAVDHRTAL
ncbi:MAG: thioesterase family protein [Frankia sp.]|nr:thioesterase family protein [Frankia sp.]